MESKQPKPPFEVHTFNVRGHFIERQAFNLNDLEVAETIAKNYSREHSGFAQVIDADGSVVIYEPELKAEQEVVPEPGILQPGDVSKVPYTMIMQVPSPDLNQNGVETLYYKSSKIELSSVVEEVHRYLGFEIAQVVETAFRHGNYRLELLVGDASIKIYKHSSAE